MPAPKKSVSDSASPRAVKATGVAPAGQPAAPAQPGKGASDVAWTFLTNHSHVLICIAREPDIRLRDVAFKVGITERAVQRIVADLEEAGVLHRSREGRRNTYSVDNARPLRHPLESHRAIGDLLNLVK